MLQSCHVYDRWADSSYQTPPRSSALEFCAQLYNRQYHGIIPPWQEVSLNLQ